MFAIVFRSQAKLAFSVYTASTAFPASQVHFCRHPYLAISGWRGLSSATVVSKNHSDESRLAVPDNPSNTLFVGKVPRPGNVDKIRKVFSNFGAVKEVHLALYSRSRDHTYAFVEFEHVEDALKAYRRSVAEPIRTEFTTGPTFKVNIVPKSKSRVKERPDTLKIYGWEGLNEYQIRRWFRSFNVTDITIIPARGHVVMVTFTSFASADIGLIIARSQGKEFFFGKTGTKNTPDTLVAIDSGISGEDEVRNIFRDMQLSKVRIRDPRPHTVFVQFDNAETALGAYLKARGMAGVKEVNFIKNFESAAAGGKQEIACNSHVTQNKIDRRANANDEPIDFLCDSIMKGDVMRVFTQFGAVKDISVAPGAEVPFPNLVKFMDRESAIKAHDSYKVHRTRLDDKDLILFYDITCQWDAVKLTGLYASIEEILDFFKDLNVVDVCYVGGPGNWTLVKFNNAATAAQVFRKMQSRKLVFRHSHCQQNTLVLEAAENINLNLFEDFKIIDIRRICLREASAYFYFDNKTTAAKLLAKAKHQGRHLFREAEYVYGYRL